MMKTIVVIMCFLPKYDLDPQEFCSLRNQPSYVETTAQYCRERENISPEYTVTVCREFDEHTDVDLLR